MVSTCKAEEYLATFSTSAWMSLTLGQQAEHSLSNCHPCSEKYEALQQAFPALPCYSAPSRLVLLPAQDDATSVREVTRTVLEELNRSYQERFGQRFSDAAVQYCGTLEGIEKRKSRQEKKRQARQIQRKCCDAANDQYTSTAALTFLSQNESVQGYQRKRLMQSFEQLPSGRPEKSHIPSKDNHTQDTDAIVKEVQMWPESQQMNWSEIARRHNVPGRNGGQIVKTIVQESGRCVSFFSKSIAKAHKIQ